MCIFYVEELHVKYDNIFFLIFINQILMRFLSQIKNKQNVKIRSEINGKN